MEFYQFKKLFESNFEEMIRGEKQLFEVNIDQDEFWNLYLDSFPEGTNPIYKTKRKYDCNCCRRFIKKFGNVVTIKDNEIRTMWDFKTNDTTFQPVLDSLSTYLKAREIKDVHIKQEKIVGNDHNVAREEWGDFTRYNHFSITLPQTLLHRANKSIEELKGEYRDRRNVFKRSLDEITIESILVVLELISQKSLYKGEEWENTLKTFLSYKKAYERIDSDKRKDNYTWYESAILESNLIAKIRNHSIGTLLVNISENMDLDVAVKKYEAIVAPTNYKRPKAIFTKKMLEEAKKTITNLGYLDSLKRRFAVIDDISINNVIFVNRDSAKRMIDADIFEEMTKEVPINPKKFSKIEEIDIETFVKDIVPAAHELEVLLENKNEKNLVSLIAPEFKNSKTMFKWNNNFSWAYKGNITDSMIKENVKNAGGKIDGVLRFSIQWNDKQEWNKDDYDAHVIEPNGNEIYYARKHSLSSGDLDVDIMNPDRNVPAVENITWSTKSRMSVGTYKMFVKNYAYRGGTDGFKAEIEFNGQIYRFEYNKGLRNKEDIQVAEVTLDRDGNFTLKEKLTSEQSSKEIWGLRTNQFVPVSSVMYSPNYWDEQKGIGNKHYFFMLKDCRNEDNPNGFYNEFLKEDLMQHRKVFEALGGKMKVEDSEEQLSGLGFSSTQRNELIVKVKGQTERVVKIKF